MKLVRYAGLALALALAAVAHAAQAETETWQPTAAESDAFVRAYAYTVMEALMDEALQIRVDAGTLTPSVAACLRKNMQLANLYATMRPIVARTFTSKQSLAQATAFFTSPTGVKMKKIGAQQLRDALRQSENAPKSAAHADPQLAATPADARAARQFADSQSGKDFSQFVSIGLPQLGEVDVFGDAAEKCVHASAK